MHNTIGNLSNGDGHVNKNGIKAIGLDWQNNNFAHDLKCLISCFEEDVNIYTRQQLSSSFSELRYSLLKFNSRKNYQDLMNVLNEME